MKRRYIRITLLIILASIVFTGYIKGCNSIVYPRQKAIVLIHKDGTTGDSILTIPVGKQYKRNKFHDFIFGKHNREIWALPVCIKVFNIEKNKGGFKILKKGGNKQTINLRIVNNEGKEYVLRSIDKDQANALPPMFRNKMLIYIIRDETSAINPYGAFIIPKLADAINLYHTNPELVYVPYDENFGQYTDLFKERVAILEEYPNSTWNNQTKFNHAEQIIGTTEMFEHRYKVPEAMIDEKEFVKARLFDILISDWDRHVGQWKWAAFTNENKTIYKPIPRDRDAAFYKFDSGVIPFIALFINNKFQSFNKDYKSIKGLTKNGKKIDRMIINGTSETEFLEIAKYIQTSIKDSTIENAVKELPEEVYKKNGAEIIQTLKSRKDKLYNIAQKYYKLLFTKVNIVGTDESENIIVERINNNFTSVTIKNNKDTSYHHVFDHKITKEINVYGLNGADEYTITGDVKEGIIINLYGGKGYDKYKDKSSVKGYRKKTIIFDSIEGNDIESSDETEDKTSNDPEILYYDRVGIND